MKPNQPTVEEVQAYEKARATASKCGVSWVQPMNCIVLNGHLHAGVVTHICARPKHANGEECECTCKARRKNI